MSRICFILIILIFAVSHTFAQRRPDFNNFGPNNFPNSSNDSLISKKFVYTYYLTKNLNILHYDFDTSMLFLHITEPYYKSTYLDGNLGSENSAGYTSVFSDYNQPGIQLGHFGHRFLLKNDIADRIIEVNRPLWNIHYSKGFSIPNSNLKIGFYKKFNRNILLNFDFIRATDDSWLGRQPNDFSMMNIKMYQRDSGNKRRSYVSYYNTELNEIQSRGVINGANELASVEEKITKVEFGNLFALNDSTLSPLSSKLFSRISITSHGYDFDDRSISDSENDYYKLVTKEDTLHFKNRLQSVSFYNELNWQRRGWDMTASLDLRLLHHSQNSLDESFEEILLGLSAKHERTESDISFGSNFQLGFLDSFKDIQIHPYFNWRINGNQTAELSLLFSSLKPSLLEKSAQVNQILVWDELFTNIKRLGLRGSYESRLLKGKIEAGITLFQQAVVFNEKGRPSVIDKDVRVSTLGIKKSWNPGPLQTQHFVLFQHINTTTIARPDIQYRGKLAIDFSLFKKKLLSSLGVDVYFIPDFTTPDYQPVFGIFYEDQIINKSGNLFLVNPFINFKIETFFIFLKMTNATSRLSTQNYFLVTDYPLFDYRIHFGIRWNLLD